MDDDISYKVIGAAIEFESLGNLPRKFCKVETIAKSRGFLFVKNQILNVFCFRDLRNKTGTGYFFDGNKMPFFGISDIRS